MFIRTKYELINLNLVNVIDQTGAEITFQITNPDLDDPYVYCNSEAVASEALNDIMEAIRAEKSYFDMRDCNA